MTSEQHLTANKDRAAKWQQAMAMAMAIARSALNLTVEYYVYAVLDARCSLPVGAGICQVCRAESSGERPLQPRESHLLPTPRCLLQLTRSNRRFVARVCVCVFLCVCAPVH